MTTTKSRSTTTINLVLNREDNDFLIEIITKLNLRSRPAALRKIIEFAKENKTDFLSDIKS